MDTLKGLRDRAILATFLYHGLREAELCGLKLKDVQERRGVRQLRVLGKGDKVRFIVLAQEADWKIQEYLEDAGHLDDKDGPLFRPVRNRRSGGLRKHLEPKSLYKNVVKYYARQIGLDSVEGFCVHSLRATAATNALENGADIAKVQEWLGHASVSTTCLYDKRQNRPEDSPTLRVRY